jgi:hypothetical protein
MPSTFSKQTIGYGIAAVVAILGNTALAWVKEENPAVKALMKQLLYHHWIAHGVAVLLVFFVLGFILSRIVRPSPARALAAWLVAASAAGALGIVILFLFG